MMTFLDSFTHQHINDVLKNTLLWCDKNAVSFSANKCATNENLTILNVKDGDIEKKYVLVKIPKNLETRNKQEVKDSKVLYPVFVIENNNKECYGAYECQHWMDHLVSPEPNNTQCLKIILQSLAEHQASDLANNEVVEKPSKYNLKDISDEVTCLDFFRDIDTIRIKESIEYLQLELNKLLDDSNFLVRSIGCPFAKNVYLNKETTKSIFLNISSTELVPPAYDALLIIFALSDEKFRQRHFEILVYHYFESLTTSLHGLKSKLAEKIKRSYSEHEVQVLLPVIKLKRASSLIKLKNHDNLQELLSNLLHFLKYPLVNQEDIYEAAKNKLGTNDYYLLDYSLVCLSEKNGHLGEYFHLDINIRVQEREEQLQLFAKVLKTSTDFLKAIVEGGPAKKEDFFYKTFVPLCTKHGLDSLLDFAPKCYLSRINWLLVLDDLSRQGYTGLKPNSVLNYEGLKSSVISLAKFHSCTMLLEEILSKESERVVTLDQDYGEFLEDTLLVYEDGHPFQPMYDNTLEAFYHIVEKFPEITKKLNSCPEDIRARIKEIFFSIFVKVKNSGNIRRVINHGDMYVANMLFKYGKDKLITEGLLIDFQLLRYVTPTYDLLFFLFENSTKETRDKYLKILIEDYYSCVSENIRKLNFDPEVVFPKKSFDENIKYMMSAGPVGALMYAHVIHIDPDFREEIFHDQKKSDYYLIDHKNELVDLSWEFEHYRIIMKGLVEDLVDIIQSEF